MANDLGGLDPVRAVLRDPIRASESTLAEPGAVLADTNLAVGVRVYLVRDQPYNPLSFNTFPV